jgi:predicted O-methyltransferase YrrM
MNTLTNMAPLLERLFSLSTRPARPSPMCPAAERERLMRSKTEYLDLYGALKDFPLAVSREAGALLYMLARSSGAKTIVEFGTSFGVSTLHLAAALRDNWGNGGGGRLITTEFEPSKAERAQEHLVAGGVMDLVEIRLATRCRPWLRTCPRASISSYWTAPRRSIRRSWRCWKAACGRAR